MLWNFVPPTQPPIIPPGQYIARIAAARSSTSKSGLPMLIIEFDISGQQERITYFRTLDNSSKRAEYLTNLYLSKFCESFALDPRDLSRPDFDPESWIGAVGAVIIGHYEKKDGSKEAEIKAFISRAEQSLQWGQAQQQPQTQQQPRTQPKPEPTRATEFDDNAPLPF